ncbi:hypothetical protein DCC79_07385 [bacterium]|nr:MAG: hypothetical protein DCC79_07385 [bacterium]
MPRSRRAWLSCLALSTLLAWPPAAAARAPSQAPATAVSRATVTLGRATVTGQAAPGADLTLEVRSAAGALRGGDAGGALPFIGVFSLDAVDADGQAVAIVAGDRVKVGIDGGAAIEDSVPPLTIAGDADTDTVTGTAAPGAAITVTVSTGLGAAGVSQATVADGGGRYSAAFAGRADLQAGSTLRVDHVRGPFTFRAERPLTEQLNVRLHGATVTGLGPNGAVVRVELRRAGQAAGIGQGTAAFLGLFSITLTDPGGAETPVQPGDVLSVAFGGAAAVDYVVPSLAITPDAAADTVAGTAPAGATVRVTVGTGAGAPAQTATAGTDGRYSVGFAGSADIAPGTTGQVAVVERRQGLDVNVTRAWGVVRLTVRLGESGVTGIASPGDPVRLTLRDAQGVGKARATAAVDAGGAFGGGATFQATLANAAGDPVEVVPTYRLELRRDGESVDLPIPRLTAEVDPAADRVSGLAPAGVALAVSAGGLFNQRTVTVTVGADGRYGADFAGTPDIVPGTPVTVLLTTAEGHQVILATAAAALRVWPEAGRLDGTIAGGADAAITVTDAAGQARAAATATASFLGQFNATLRDAAGNVYYPRPRDRVRVAFGEAVRELTVPPLGIEWDTAAERVSGETTPGGTVTVRAQPPAGQGNAAETRAVDVQDTGFYAADFAPDMDLRAGSRLQITYAYPNGDRSRVDRILPYLDVQVGGNAVRGYALPRADVRATARDGVTTVGTGTARAADDQSFDLRTALRGQPAPIRTGQRIEVTFDGRTLAVGVGPLAARLVAAGNGWAVRGTGPISTALTARFVDSGGTARTVTVRTDATGAYSRTLPGGIDGLAGTRVEVGHLDADGHRFHTLDVRPRLIAYVGSPRVDIQGTPLGSVDVTLSRIGGGAAAGAAGQLDTAGAASLALAGAQPTIAVSQTLAAAIVAGTAADPARAAASMTVADVAVALDTPANVVRGRVPPRAGFFGRFATVRAFLRGQAAPRTLNVPTDAAGAFTLDTTNPPGAGQGFALADATGIEVVHTAPDGHQTIALAVPAIRVWLPWATKR